MQQASIVYQPSLLKTRRMTSIPSQDSTMSTYSMFEVLYYRQKTDAALQGYTRGGSKQASIPVNCERFVVLRDLHGRAGANVSKL